MRAFNKKELAYYNFFHLDKDYEKEAKALDLTGKTVLEVGSGTGLMTAELRRLGYDVDTLEPTDPDATYPCRYEDAVFRKKYDNLLMLYDVVNYMKDVPNEWPSDNIIIEMWPDKPVRFFTHKRVGLLHRVRLGIRLSGRAHLLYIYWGMGLALAYHKLYLHKIYEY